MKLIVGLGNPGKEYEETRHNIGFKVIDLLSRKLDIPLANTKFKGIYGMGMKNGERVILLKPMTFMNLSGEAVRPIMDYYDIEPENLLVIYDELDLPVGKIRLRYKGSSGGHNGLKSIISHIGTQEFNRIRIGIGRPELGVTTVDHVLGKFRKQEKGLVDETISRAAEASVLWLEKPFLEVMNIYNK